MDVEGDGSVALCEHPLDCGATVRSNLPTRTQPTS